MEKWEVFNTYNVYGKNHNEYTIISEQSSTICTTYSKEIAEQVVKEHNSYLILMDAFRHIADITDDNFTKEYIEKVLSKLRK